MAEQSAAKNAFILTWLKDTRDADKPIENNPDTNVYHRSVIKTAVFLVKVNCSGGLYFKDLNYSKHKTQRLILSFV